MRIQGEIENVALDQRFLTVYLVAADRQDLAWKRRLVAPFVARHRVVVFCYLRYTLREVNVHQIGFGLSKNLLLLRYRLELLWLHSGLTVPGVKNIVFLEKSACGICWRRLGRNKVPEEIKSIVVHSN